MVEVVEQSLANVKWPLDFNFEFESPTDGVVVLVVAVVLVVINVIVVVVVVVVVAIVVVVVINVIVVDVVVVPKHSSLSSKSRNASWKINSTLN